MSNQFLEIEYKYKADDMTLGDFTDFCRKKGPVSYLEASGYDHFYMDSQDANFFGRHRIGPDLNQVTVKRKTFDANNYVREEINLNLDRNVGKPDVDALFKFLGYSKAASLYKTCFVYKYEWYTLSYYVCFNLDMKEIGRFMEIEMCEKREWGAGEAEQNLSVLEKLCKPLGITPQGRIKKSLFEMFGRGKQ